MAHHSGPGIIQRTVSYQIINQTGNFLRKIGLQWPSLSSKKLWEKAQKKAGITLKDPEFAEGLEVLVKAIKEEGRPNTFGLIAANTLLERLLIGRLQMEQHIQQHPEVLEEKIERPVFIIGLPRTGTTILHALMHEDPNNRSPLCWECLLPYPAPQPKSFEEDPRKYQIDKEFQQFFKLLPDFQSMHLMSADTPQECIGIHTFNFQSFQFLAQYRMPTYLNWLNNSDFVAQYRFHKKMLQFLQSGGVKGARWLLKSPVHLASLDSLLEVYPDAIIISTHRHPAKVSASVSSLMSTVRSAYSDQEDPRLTAQEQLSTWSNYLDRFTNARQAHPDKEDQFYELYFEDFIREPVQSVENIYRHFGWTFSEELSSRLDRYMKNNPRDKHGRHHYTLEQFGLEEEAINQKYSSYISYLEQTQNNQ